MNLLRGNNSEEIRRNPRNIPGKVRGGAGDLTGDEQEQAETWEELTAEEEGRTESRIDDVGNAESAMLGGTGDLDHVRGFQQDEPRRQKSVAEDDPKLINPDAT